MNADVVRVILAPHSDTTGTETTPEVVLENNTWCGRSYKNKRAIAGF